MAKYEEVGGMLYIGSAPPSEQLPEHDATINDDQVIGSAVLAGPVTFEATVIITGYVVVI
tara:strand:+ start:260 stop:439 length:180 start_codon:yes stop_codon:yes gene_type:complete